GNTSSFSASTAVVVLAPVASLSPSPLSFGAWLVGTSSTPALTLTLTNTGNAPLNISSVATALPFNIASQTCGPTLAATASCTYSLAFSPTTQGTFTGSFTLTSNDPVTPTATVNLTGVG